MDGLNSLHPSLRALAECGVERRYRKGTLFIQEGEPGGPLYFIMRGRVRAFTARIAASVNFSHPFPACEFGSFARTVRQAFSISTPCRAHDAR